MQAKESEPAAGDGDEDGGVEESKGGAEAAADPDKPGNTLKDQIENALERLGNMQADFESAASLEEDIHIFEKDICLALVPNQVD